MINAKLIRATWQEVEKEGTEIGVGTNDTLAERLRERCGSIYFFADTGTYAGMQSLGIEPPETCMRFYSNRA